MGWTQFPATALMSEVVKWLLKTRLKVHIYPEIVRIIELNTST